MYENSFYIRSYIYLEEVVLRVWNKAYFVSTSWKFAELDHSSHS